MTTGLSFYLARLIGLFLAFVGVALITRPQEFQQSVKDAAKDNAILLLISIIPLIVGIAIISCHNIWTNRWPLIITLFGWVIFIVGFIRLYFRAHFTKQMVLFANKKKHFVWTGVFFLIFGAYLIGKGFFGDCCFFITL